MTVTVFEGEGEWQVRTPDLRLVFERLGDRWAHRIDIGPAPWQTLAESVEWADPAADPLRVVSPVYQEVQVQRDGDDSAIALAVGQAGPHHFSASVRVRYGVYEAQSVAGLLNAYPKSLVVFDVADRCRAETLACDSHYRVHNPPAVIFLNGPGPERQGGSPHDPQPSFVWEPNTPDNYDVVLDAALPGGPPGSVSLTASGPDGWGVRVSAGSLVRGGTTRLRYAWSQTRVFLPTDPRPPGPVVPRSLLEP